MNIRVYTDGACKANGKENNTGSYGFVVVDEKDNILYETCVKELNTTNNIMEMTAILKAFELLKIIEYSSCIIYSDSRYCVDGINSWMYNWEKQGWKKSSKGEIKNKELWKKLFNLAKNSSRVKVKWIKGHQNGNNWNNYIDDKIQNEDSNIEDMEQTTIIELPLHDVKGQSILDKKLHKIELAKDYLKYEYDFFSEETDFDELEKIIGDTEDDTLLNAYEGNEPLLKVRRRYTAFTNKDNITTISLVKNSNDDESMATIMIAISDGDSYKLHFREVKEAKNVSEQLIKWRWNQN